MGEAGAGMAQGGAGPQVAEAPLPTVRTSGPGDTLRCPLRIISDNRSGGRGWGWGTQDRDGKSQSICGKVLWR